MHRYRVVHCLRAPVGGLFRHVRDLAREQSLRGHDVGLVCDSSSSDALTEGLLESLKSDLALGVQRVAMPRDPGFGDIAAARAVRAFVATARADIVHGHGAKGGAYARFAASLLKRRGTPIAAIYTPHGGSLHYHPRSLKGRFFMAAERWLARRTDGMLFESAFAARTYAANAGAPDCPVRVVHNGLRPEEFVRVAPDAAADDFVFVGELRMLKGVDVLIAATALLNGQRPCRVTIVGAGPDAERFRQDAVRRGLDGVITFPGAMPARDAFRRGRALVMPSRAESLPYVALEAAAAGLPLIATDVGGIGEIVQGVDTKPIPAGDATALARAMWQVLDYPAAAHDRAERLRRSVEQRFSVATMTDGILSCYGEAMAHALERVAAARTVIQPA